ncbi:hypothetical protein ACUXIW_001914 [Ralstonia pickettii]|uniref:Transmembrane protein n=1 Tax=Ralstonia thomasii TaxID=3058596 RepID=A0ABN9IZ27_9RALS|nr:hypothetical protein [Ralstonia pickettii]MDH6641342.1 hypothetical protein [Ralstonia sp. GP73]CAJ0794191.1 hypothetical protein LMG18095_02568 [Ralstonia sp. LMG 18095]MBA9852335.1 hypothetical protein [Ralstonia pickettii]MBA9878693.1 hypothetical protein [Ralstonia pickettii]
MKDLLKSIAGLPAWVQTWLAILVVTNVASLTFLDSPVGRYTAMAFAIVAAVNVPIMVLQRGLTRLLSFPHFVWVPLVLYLASQLWGASPLPTGPVRMYAWVVFVVNSISLTFDIIEAVRWLRGGKEVLGLERI